LQRKIRGEQEMMPPWEWAWKYFVFFGLLVAVLCWASFTGVKRIEIDNLQQDIAECKQEQAKLTNMIGALNNTLLNHRHKYSTGEVIFK
jgi:hypothetical protein